VLVATVEKHPVGIARNQRSVLASRSTAEIIARTAERSEEVALFRRNGNMLFRIQI
jgi:hypothetical protein